MSKPNIYEGEEKQEKIVHFLLSFIKKVTLLSCWGFCQVSVISLLDNIASVLAEKEKLLRLHYVVSVPCTTIYNLWALALI